MPQPALQLATKATVALTFGLVLAWSAARAQPSSSSVSASCGNGRLDATESCASCPADAGVCAPFAVMCGGPRVCIDPPQACPNVTPCKPVPPAVIADARAVVNGIRPPSPIRAAARRVLAALLDMNSYCPGTGSTALSRLVLSSEAPDLP